MKPTPTPKKQYRPVTFIEGEKWMYIGGYEGYYQVSSLGRVASVDRFVFSKVQGRVMRYANLCKSHPEGRGYHLVSLSRDGSSIWRLVHRLVAMEFIPNPENKPQVNHKNGIKTDNRVENLEWCTASENMKHSYDSGIRSSIKGSKNVLSTISDQKIKEIVEYSQRVKRTYAEYGRLFGISKAYARRIVMARGRPYSGDLKKSTDVKDWYQGNSRVARKAKALL